MRGAHPERALERHLALRVKARAGEVLLVAVSGGADSVAAAALSAAHASRAGATLVLGHVNHGTRRSSWQDEAVVLAVGALLRARVVTRALPPGSFDEARLREERYAALSGIARTVGAARVFAAHHAQDQTETVLLALFRGAGPQALRGMPERRALDGDLVLERPLLRVDRAELAAYCVGRGLPFVLDATNEDRRYRRNALRAALTEMRRHFPRLDEAVARCAEIASDEAEQTGRAQMRRFLRERLREGPAEKNALRDLSFERLDAAAHALENGRIGKYFLKNGMHMEIRAGEPRSAPLFTIIERFIGRDDRSSGDPMCTMVHEGRRLDGRLVRESALRGPERA